MDYEGSFGIATYTTSLRLIRSLRGGDEQRRDERDRGSKIWHRGSGQEIVQDNHQGKKKKSMDRGTDEG